MTREEALQRMKAMRESTLIYGENAEAYDMAIEALSAEPQSDDLIIKGAKGVKDGLYNIKDGKLFQYKAKGGTVRVYEIVPSAEAEPKMTEEVREALMRLTMCAREECGMCKYKDECGFDFQYKISTENMNTLADALLRSKCEVDAKSAEAEQTQAEKCEECIHHGTHKDNMTCKECASAETENPKVTERNIQSGDLISRADARNAVQDHFNDDGFKGYFDGQKMMDRINALPSADRPTGWVAVSDRLPDTHTEYMTENPWSQVSISEDTYQLSDAVLGYGKRKAHNDDDPMMAVVWYEDDGYGRARGFTGWITAPDCEEIDVIAWMPLPGPYCGPETEKGEKNNE